MGHARVGALIWSLIGAAVFSSACHSSDAPAAGEALAKTNGFSLSISAIPGDQWVLNFPDLDNVSHDPITIKSIVMQGVGLTSVVAIKQVWVAPRDKVSTPDWAPGGVFKTLPPSIRQLGQCYRQRLVNPANYVIRAGAEPRVAVWMEAVGLGTFTVTGPLVTYVQGGHTYRQFLREGMDGSVHSSGQPLRPNGASERACMTPQNELPSGTKSV
jgi:hypothetical protein